MKSMRRTFVYLVLALAVWLPQRASACAVCMGDPEDPITKSIGWGILVLLGIIMSVLGGIAGFFVYIVRRSAATESSEPAPELAAATAKA